MAKNTTYFLGILITILAGSYFFYTCCSECGKESNNPSVQKTTGTKEANMELGLRKVRFAKSYLVKNGISEAKTTVSSQGQDVPQASNAPKEGKATNKRTIVTLN